MKRQREDWLKYMDGMIKQTTEDAFAQGIFPISQEVWDTVNGRRRKTHISWIQYMALNSRVSTLDAVEREVAKSRQEPESSVIREVSNPSFLSASGRRKSQCADMWCQNVNKVQTTFDVFQSFFDRPPPDYVTASIIDSSNTKRAKEPKRILSDVLILEYVEVEMMASNSSSQYTGTEGESTKAVRDLLLAWGPITSKMRWDFIKAQDGYDDYAEISEG
jgi:hypothetical protein